MAGNTNYICLIQQSATANPISVEAPMPDSFAFDAGATYDQPLPQGFTQNKIANTVAAAIGVRLATQAMSAKLWSGNTDTNLSLEIQFHTETDPVADVRTPIVNLLKLTMPSTSTSTGILSSPGPSFDFTAANVAATGKAAVSLIGAAGVAVVNTVQNFFNPIGAGNTQIGSLNNTSQTTNDGAKNTIPAPTTQNPSLGTAAFWNTKLKNKISIRVGNYLYFDSVVITRVSITSASNFDAQTGLPHHCRVMVEFTPLFMLTQQDLDTLFINPSSNTTSGTNNYGFNIAGPNVGNVQPFHL